MKVLDLNTTMDSFNLFKESSLFLKIYVLNKGGNYGNIFTSIRNRDLEVFDWIISDYNDYLIKIEGCFPSSIVEEFFVDITKNESLRIKAHGIQFGEVTKRSWVFIPYEQQNSVSNGWWPGTLNTGFWMQQWYSLNASFNLSTETAKWIRNDSGFNLERLLDLLNNIIFIQAFDSYNPTIKYNPDNKIISFFFWIKIQWVNFYNRLYN